MTGTRPRRKTLSVVLMTKNEEVRLPACLDQVAGWADEVVVIDDLSTDRTVEVARRYTDRVFSYASDDDHYRQWNRGIDHATGDWILHIDADELVTPQLKGAIDQMLAIEQPYAAFELMRRNVFLGHAMRHGGWYHRHRILFRRTRARCVGKGIHVQLHVEGRVGFLDADVLHFPFDSLGQFLDRQNHYTSVEADVMAEEPERVPARRVLYQAVVRPPKLLWKFYVKKRARRDGWHGLAFSVLYAFTHFLLWAKYWERTYGRAAGTRTPAG